MIQKLESAKSQLEHLETTIDRLQSEQPDAKSLNASMESDKVAAARAVSQNVELKQQLEEIQLAFVQVVSSCNVKLFGEYVVFTHTLIEGVICI